MNNLFDRYFLVQAVRQNGLKTGTGAPVVVPPDGVMTLDWPPGDSESPDDDWDRLSQDPTSNTK
jgi:hypothetical protein